jgi:hypothetical protein
MNRIRKYNNKYQVLITPHQPYNPGFEFLLGSWTDPGLIGFEVKEYDAYYDAECEALRYPDINWTQLVDYHRAIYHDLKDKLGDMVQESRMALQFKSMLLTPELTKNKMFDRVISGQEMVAQKNTTVGFRPVLDMNDIIEFVIINPWTRNLREMEQRLIANTRLNIFNKIEKNNIVHLIGRTDIGTTYEILLVPSILNNWMEWRNINCNLSPSRHLAELKNCIKTQKIIDDQHTLR